MEQNQGKTLISELLEKVNEKELNIVCTGLEGSEKAYLILKLYESLKKNIIIITYNQKEAEKLIEDINFFKKLDNIILLPEYKKNFFKDFSFSAEESALKIKALYSFLNKDNYIGIIPVPALMQKVMPKKSFLDKSDIILPNEEFDREVLTEKLIKGGYTDSIIVENPGEYCIRGGIIDIFSPQYENPVRIEFFGDTAESIRFFSPITQRTLKTTDEAIIIPASETVLEDKKIIIDEKLVSLFDYLDKTSLFINLDAIKNDTAFKETNEKSVENYIKNGGEKKFSITPEDIHIKCEEVRETLSRMQTLNFKSVPVNTDNIRFDFDIENNENINEELKNFYNNENVLKPLADWITDKIDVCHVAAVCGTASQADRLKFLLSPYGVDFNIIEDFSFLDIENRKRKAFIYKGYIDSGFVWKEQGLAVITEKEIFGAKKRRSKTPVKTSHAERLIFEDLKKDDFVVHVEHGIGRYIGIVKLGIKNAEGDYLHIEYKDNDRLYLPVERMSMLQKYIGADDSEPVIDKLGGTRWEKLKKSVKKSIEKIAGELISIYAARKVNKGFSFSEPDALFHDFEASFPYEETDDQIKAIDDVLADMEKENPMDRLVCGDVGYGKTEVALRAAFKAASDGKQTALLSPTTILVQQHYITFKNRFKKYPVNIACMNRFKSKKEQKEILDYLKRGKIDIIIGTQRLLQKDVEFKDIGLLILDEEQRFGVKDKEKLKKIKKTVDVLALTATPIPRTLHMSMMGIRDISIITTPPEGRRSVITYVSEYDEALTVKAIKNEMERGGQIFFVHNSINSIWSIAGYIKKLVPDIKIGVAHGRLEKKELENVMLDFLDKKIDMLLSTTIIESGLDIPNANTIIVNKADRFGLAQLYQLRGRVGRAGEQAFAYFFISKESLLTKDAQKRLKVLMEHTSLGSGFQIAMKDLQIRGGGNMLGISQSGKIAAVGYDLYLKLMEEAVLKLKGEKVKEKLEPEIRINIPGFIPETYIPDIDMRLAAYRNLSKLSDITQLLDFKEELIDRYGKMPTEAKNLFIKIMIKILAAEACVKKLELPEKSKFMFLYFSEKHLEDPTKLIDMILAYKNRFQLVSDYVLKVTIEHFSDIKKALKDIAVKIRS